LVPNIKETSLIKVPLKDLKRVPDVLNCVIEAKPSSIESYDDETVRLAVKYLPDILDRHTKGFVERMRFFFTFLPEIFLYYFYGFPRLTMIIEFGGSDKKEVNEKVKLALHNLEKNKFVYKSVSSEIEKKKMWAIRRESYNLLRSHSDGKEIATFIEDVVVPPNMLFEFLPKINDILHSYDLRYSIAGHAGSGNFHIFPLMDFKDKNHKEKMIEISKKVYELVASCGGSITAEHNDGISRTPFLHYIFSEKMLNLFVGVKNIFDIQNIFNPHKKTGVSEEYFKKSMR
jgi:FAD/FMN-containing dehydrogenase